MNDKEMKKEITITAEEYSMVAADVIYKMVGDDFSEFLRLSMASAFVAGTLFDDEKRKACIEKKRSVSSKNKRVADKLTDVFMELLEKDD